MKKKFNINLLKKYSKVNHLEKEELKVKKASQLAAQKKLLELWGKVEFRD